MIKTNTNSMQSNVETQVGEGATETFVDFVDLRALKVRELTDAQLAAVAGGIAKDWSSCTCYC
jgi:hypothetical protein